MALQDTDILVAQRGTTTYKVPASDVKSYTVGGVLAASETVQGIIEIATQAEADAGTDDARAITPLKMATYVANNAPAPPSASETVQGIVELATAAETTTGTDNTRAVHPAGLKTVTDAERTTSDTKYVDVAGDTMTGDLTVPSLNGGQLAGFRNILINGDLKVNQRGVTIAAATVGQYGPDRWKKTGASTMTQIIESVNFEPGAVYTLSGTGVTTQQLTAPASGDWTLPNIPITASKIQLEPGAVATPFERRPIGTEETLCQRYFFRLFNTVGVQGVAVPGVSIEYAQLCVFPVTMRATPTVKLSQFNDDSNMNTNKAVDLSPQCVSLRGCTFSGVPAIAKAFGFWFPGIEFSAEL